MLSMDLLSMILNCRRKVQSDNCTKIRLLIKMQILESLFLVLRKGIFYKREMFYWRQLFIELLDAEN